MISTIAERSASAEEDPTAKAASTAPTAPRRALRGQAATRRHTLFQPGWPITFAFAGFPLWWVLGISNFIGHIAAVLLLLELLRRRRIRVPRSFGMWLLFLSWVAVGALLLQVDAPYATPVTSVGTYMTWAYRFGWYLSATVFMLYIGNMREELSSQRISRSLSMFFLTIVAGGWLAALMPGLEFPSVLEVALPRGISQIEFVNFLIHPTVVQDYAASAAGHARPSAPFAYANFWGLNFACALPFFIVDWFGPKSGWRRRSLGVLILLLAAVPAILSWNRGLWLAVLAMIALLAVRSAVRGHFKTLVLLVVATAVVVGTILLSPLGEVIQSRLDNPASNSTRSQLATLTTDSTLEGSPIVGFGSTRDSATSFYSIAGGDRPNCPDCSPPAMGTQGQLWLVLFAQGLLGVVFFYGFLLIWVARGLRMRLAASTAALCAVLAHLLTMTVYDSLGIGTVVLLVAIALLWREYDDSHPPGPATGGIYTMGGYLRLLWHNFAWVSVWGVCGALLGAGVQLSMGNPVIADVSMIVPAESASDSPSLAASLDTLNQVAQGATVRSAIANASGGDAGSLEITATPNSRILNLRYTDHDMGSALAGVSAGADAVLSAHSKLLEQERASVVKELDAQYAALLRSLAIVDTTLSRTEQRGDVTGTALLQQTRAAILADSASIANESARVGSITFEVGRVTRPATARVTYDPLLVKAVSGLMLGLLAGALTARVRDARRRRVARVRDLSSALGTGVIARVGARSVRWALAAGGDEARTGRMRAISELMRHSGAVAVMPGDDSALTGDLASLLDAELALAEPEAAGGGTQGAPIPTAPQIVIVVSGTARFGNLTWRVIRHRRNGLGILGLILITDLDSTRRPKTHRNRRRPAMTESGAAGGTTAY